MGPSFFFLRNHAGLLYSRTRLIPFFMLCANGANDATQQRATAGGGRSCYDASRRKARAKTKRHRTCAQQLVLRRRVPYYYYYSRPVLGQGDVSARPKAAQQ